MRQGNTIPVMHRPPGRLKGHDPSAYLQVVLKHLPTQRASEIAELLAHRSQDVGRLGHGSGDRAHAG